GFTSVVRSLPFPPLGHLFDPQDVPPPQLNCIPIANTQKKKKKLLSSGCKNRNTIRLVLIIVLR
ncbi:unnamed protein product, partial [Prunus brigantina]